MSPLCLFIGSTWVRVCWLTLLTLLTLLALLPSSPLLAQALAAPTWTDSDYQLRAERFLDALDQADFTAAEAMLDERARQALAGGALAKVWQGLDAQLGARQKRGPVRLQTQGERRLAVAVLEFASMQLDARISFDAQLAIDGFRLLPSTAAAAVVSPPASPDHSERELSLRGLGGSLMLPAGAGPHPAVLLLHGSGPHDRNQTIGPNPFLHDIASALARRGFASLRFDKRSRALPETLPAGRYTVDHEVIDDALAAIAWLRSQPDLDSRRLYLLGHSLGGMLAPRIAARAPELAALVLLAAPARPLQRLVLEQSRYLAELDAEVSTDERGQLEQLERAVTTIDRLASPEPAPEPLLLNLPAAYWYDLRHYDPVATAARLTTPMLIVHAGRDYQVVAADLAAWRQGLGDRAPAATIIELPSLNHLLMEGDGRSQPQEYFQRQPPAGKALELIADWLEGLDGKQ